jgi:hypothetical protein
MSRQLTCILWIVVGARALGAQEQETILRARADSLLREWRQANALAGLQDSLRLAARLSGRDTIRVGAVTVIANPSPLPLAQAAAAADAEIERYFGTAAHVFTEHPLLVQAIDPDTAAEPPRAPLGIQIPWDFDVARVSRVLLTMADLGVADTALRAWLGGPVTPVLDTVPRRERVFVQLVTAPSHAVRQCFLGDLGACRDALSLVGAPDLVTRWYGPAERRALVTVDYAGFLDRGEKQIAFRSCASGNDAACLDLLNSLPLGSLMRPFDSDARATLLQTAAHIGGPATFQRLLEIQGDMGTRLAAATGRPLDSLVAQWRAGILRSRPASVALPPWGVWLAIGWVTVFATCGLRSSRWRVQ